MGPIFAKEFSGYSKLHFSVGAAAVKNGNSRGILVLSQRSNGQLKEVDDSSIAYSQNSGGLPAKSRTFHTGRRRPPRGVSNGPHSPSQVIVSPGPELHCRRLSRPSSHHPFVSRKRGPRFLALSKVPVWQGRVCGRKVGRQRQNWPSSNS